MGIKAPYPSKGPYDIELTRETLNIQLRAKLRISRFKVPLSPKT